MLGLLLVIAQGHISTGTLNVLQYVRVPYDSLIVIVIKINFLYPTVLNHTKISRFFHI